jgi:hypothetical protein
MQWVEEVDWRIQAYHRVYKYNDPSSDPLYDASLSRHMDTTGNRLGTEGMGWDGMGWDGMGWDGMGWDGMGWDA